jgi:sulfite exporter TauE/SafE
MSVAGLGVLGFFLGMSHAFEADHLAAVASLSTRAKSTSDGIRMGVAWGVGHSLTLFVIGAIVLTVDAVVPESLASALELGVGVMLVVLGLSVWRRLLRRRVHFHVHDHEDGTTHFHAHAHGASRDDERHEHEHGLTGRALFVGLIHGTAGSAALVLLALEKAPSVASGLAYIAVFGLGSILGMALLSAAISIPFRWSAARLTRMHNGIEALVGALTIGVGSFMILQHLHVLAA